MKDCKIINKEEIDSWLFFHSVTQMHTCISIKENGINVAWEDVNSGEIIEVHYESAL